MFILGWRHVNQSENNDLLIAAQHYMFDRSNEHSLFNYMGREEQIAEEGESEEEQTSLTESSDFKRPKLSNVDEGISLVY